MSVELRIGTLSLHGVAAHDAAAVRAALEGELIRLLGAAAAPAAPARPRHAPRDLGHVEPGAAALGAAAARAVHAELRGSRP